MSNYKLSGAIWIALFLAANEGIQAMDWTGTPYIVTLALIALAAVAKALQEARAEPPAPEIDDETGLEIFGMGSRSAPARPARRGYWSRVLWG